MELYQPHIFYNTNNLDLKTMVEICDYAYEKKDSFQVDILDCNVSWSRQYIEMTYKEIMNKLKYDSTFRVILRRGYNKPKGEIMFRTMEIPDFFLWINITPENLESLIKKFNLEENKQ